MIDGACHCLCPVSHPQQEGICTGDHDASLHAVYKDGTEIEVPVCDACARATLEFVETKQETDS